MANSRAVNRRTWPDWAGPMAIAGAIVLGALVSLCFFSFKGKITGFFLIGDTLPHSPYLDEDAIFIFHGTTGHDGQQYLAIALDPLLRSPGTIAALDNPRYRYRRILFPILGFLLSLGQTRLIPFALVAINAVCLLAIVAVAARLLRKDDGGAKLSSLVALCVPGLWTSLFLSTPDLLAVTLGFVAVACLVRSRVLAAAVLLALAGLAKETHIAVALALAVMMLIERRLRAAILLSLAALPAFVWLILTPHLLPRGTLGAAENFDWPLVGLVDGFTQVLHYGLGAKAAYEAFSMLVLLLAFVVFIRDVALRGPETRVFSFWGAPYLAMLGLSSAAILIGNANHFRVFADVFLINAIVTRNGSRTKLQATSLWLAGLASGARFLICLLRR